MLHFKDHGLFNNFNKSPLKMLFVIILFYVF